MRIERIKASVYQPYVTITVRRQEVWSAGEIFVLQIL